jgi:hypothetical protein
MTHLWLIVIGLLITSLWSGRAAGQVDPWEFEVLPYATEQRGMIELETNNGVVAKGHSQGGDGTAAGTFRSQGMWYNADEMTYGLTDRIEAAAYLTFGEPGGSSLLVGWEQISFERQALRTCDTTD